MAEKRRGLGRGIGALIPTVEERDRPSDIFFSPTAPVADETPGQGADNSETPASPSGAEKATGKGKSDARESGANPTAPAQGTASQDDLVPIPGVRVAELRLDEIVANSRQPREVFDEDDLAELASSIAEVGVLQPIVVRPAPAGAGLPYELIMGERRLRASGLAGRETIPAIIRETEDGDMLRDALLENLHRANLNPLEEASAYEQLLDDFGCTQEELARRIARSRPQISNTLRLLKLPPLVQRRVAAGVLSAGHARALLGLDDGAAMERLAQRIVAEGLSVRTTEEIVALGETGLVPERRRRPLVSEAQPQLNGLATRLADRFDTRVKVQMGARKGRITIDFATLEDLDRILGTLAPGETAAGE